MMNETGVLAVVATGGFGLGMLFFQGLLMTVRKALFSPRPWLWLMCSMVLRTGAALAGFVMISGGDFRRLLCCLAGFAAAKLLMIWLNRHAGQAGIHKEGGGLCI